MATTYQRQNIAEDLTVYNDCVPLVPTGGARIKVCYAGVCCGDFQVPTRRPSGQETCEPAATLGLEVSGIVDELCSTACTSLAKGDKVIVYPRLGETATTGVTKYITVRDVADLVPVPHSLPLEVAAILPGGALRGYAAMRRAEPFILQKLQNTEDITNVLIVGAGALGLWTLKLVHHFVVADRNNVRITVADTNIEKLQFAKEQGCYDVIHWNDSIHEEYILMRTSDVCTGGVDVIIDFVSSPRTINRALKVLKQDGVLVVGGSKYEVSFCLDSLAKNNQSVLGVHRGTRQQLHELVQLFATGQVSPPLYSVFPVTQAAEVFARFSQCSLEGRAVLRVCPAENDVTDHPEVQPTS